MNTALCYNRENLKKKNSNRLLRTSNFDYKTSGIITDWCKSWHYNREDLYNRLLQKLKFWSWKPWQWQSTVFKYQLQDVSQTIHTPLHIKKKFALDVWSVRIRNNWICPFNRKSSIETPTKYNLLYEVNSSEVYFKYINNGLTEFYKWIY
jgi:hypothetical protein